MDTAKRKLLETTIQSRFDLQKFILLTREILKSPKIKSNPVFTSKVKAQFRDSVKQFTDFGHYRDSENKVLLLVAVELKSYTSIARSRAMQRNFVKDLLQRESADAALVAFYEEDNSDWRISFVKIDYNFVGSTLEEDITPARRYSFLVGKNEKSHTAMQQLATIIFDDTISPTVSHIEEIFSIEKVTKEFFLIYKDKYLKLKECLESQAEFLSLAEKLNFTAEEFAKKLMGQLSFLYFLQRKGWLGVTANPRSIPAIAAEELLANKPSNLRDLFKKVYTLNKDQYLRSTAALRDLTEQQIMTLNFIFTNTPYEGKWGTGDTNFIRRIFSNADRNGKNFYSDYLEPLFYNALNDERGGNTYYRPFNCMIPFLNGGLFQPIVEEYDTYQIAFEIPNELFSNNNLTKEGDKGDGILDIFDRYAFTVKEDEPLEKEVAVDPEMLGKVFENLLEVNDRKSKGAFYTPREIVHYMCQESMINYLVTETGINYKNINILIRYGDIIADADNSKAAAQSGKFLMPESIRKNAQKVDNALDDIRIADPAVGSGAFPLGMINEIVRARMNLTLYLLPDEYVFNRDYAIPDQRKPYNLKLRTIRHSIHAVDIERSAVEITKLRLWLSLVVDEDNFSNIRPLPNLEYNIMCGNSLLEEFEGIKLFNETLLEKHTEIAATRDHSIEQMDIFTPQSQNILDEIYALQEKVFATSDSKQKIALKKQIDVYEWDLIEKSLIENGKVREIPKVRELKRLNIKPYFLWKLNFAKVFRDKGGFDVVIGNPPYVSHDKILEKHKLSKQYSSYQPFADLYCYFIELSMNLLNQRGSLCLITSNSYLRADYGLPIRQLLSERTNIKQVVNIEDYQLFEAAIVNTAVLLCESKPESKSEDKCLIVNSKYTGGNDFYAFVNNSSFYYDQEDFTDRSWGLLPKDKLHIKRKIELHGLSLKDLKTKIRLGIATGANEAFIINEEQKQTLIAQDEKNAEIIKPILRGRDISRYYYEQPAMYILLTKNGINVETEYPSIYKHLDLFGDKFKNRGAKGKHWTNLRACSFFDDFKEIKIIWIELTDRGRFAICKDEIYLLNSAYFLLPPKGVDPYFLLAVLNSNLINFYFDLVAGTSGMGTKRWINTYVENIPIPKASPQFQNHIGQMAKQLSILLSSTSLYSRGKLEQIEILEKSINNAIYDLYFLTPSEIETIENFKD